MQATIKTFLQILESSHWIQQPRPLSPPRQRSRRSQKSFHHTGDDVERGREWERNSQGSKIDSHPKKKKWEENISPKKKTKTFYSQSFSASVQRVARGEPLPTAPLSTQDDASVILRAETRRPVGMITHTPWNTGDLHRKVLTSSILKILCWLNTSQDETTHMSQNRNTSLVTNKASTPPSHTPSPPPTPPRKETKVPIENIHLLCCFLL